MPRVCAAANCKMGYPSQGPIPEGVTFLPFPLADLVLLEKWVRNVGRGPMFKPTKSSVVCSLHFLDEDFEILGEGKKQEKILKSDAVPKESSSETSDATRRSSRQKQKKIEEAMKKAESNEDGQSTTLEKFSVEKTTASPEKLPPIIVVEAEAETLVGPKPPPSTSSKSDLGDLKSLEIRVKRDLPRGFCIGKVTDGLLISLIENNRTSGFPQLRGSIQIKPGFEISVVIDETPLQQIKSEFFTANMRQRTLKSYGQLKDLINALSDYVTCIREDFPHIRTALTSLNNFLKLDNLDASTRRKIQFAAEQIQLIESNPKNRRYSAELIDFAAWINDHDKTWYNELVEKDVLCLPTENKLRLLIKQKMPKKESIIARIPARTPIGVSIAESVEYEPVDVSDVMAETSKSPGKRPFTGVRKSVRPPIQMRNEESYPVVDVVVGEERAVVQENEDLIDPLLREEIVVDNVSCQEERYTAEDDQEALISEGRRIEYQDKADTSVDTPGTQNITWPEPMESIENAAVPFRSGIDSIDLDSLSNYLKNSKDEWFCNGQIFKPKGGDMFLLSIKALYGEDSKPKRKQPYRSDGYKWYLNASKRPCRKTEVMHMMWYLRQEPTREQSLAGKEVIDERFQRFEYTIDDDTVLLHYVGDERVAVPWSYERAPGGKRRKKKPSSEWNYKTPIGPFGVRLHKGVRKSDAAPIHPEDVTYDPESHEKLYADLPPHAARPFRRGAQVINVDDALECLSKPTAQMVSWGQLHYPKAGDVFLLDLTMYDLSNNALAYREDGYKWLMYSRQKRMKSHFGNTIKIYWHLKQPAPGDDVRGFDPRFRRMEYALEDSRYVLMHYIGDETVVDFDTMGEGTWTKEGFRKREALEYYRLAPPSDWQRAPPRKMQRGRPIRGRGRNRLSSITRPPRAPLAFDDQQEYEEVRYQDEEGKWHTFIRPIGSDIVMESYVEDTGELMESDQPVIEEALVEDQVVAHQDWLEQE